MFPNARLWVCTAVVIFIGTSLYGCERTCTQTSECGLDSFCSEEGICDSECENSGDCAFAETCSFGRCIRFAPPRIVSVTPEGGVVGSSIELDVEISFLGPFADLTLERTEGAECVPFTTRRQSVANTGDDSVILVSFEVPALGNRFAYTLHDGWSSFDKNRKKGM